MKIFTEIQGYCIDVRWASDLKVKLHWKKTSCIFSKTQSSVSALYCKWKNIQINAETRITDKKDGLHTVESHFQLFSLGLIFLTNWHNIIIVRRLNKYF